jgi:undecaprenyl phosphate-alpha-L-ara4FN deformylase
MKIALKIDVDTRIGTVDGVPRLMRMLGRLGVPASFFAVLGPDNSGKAIRRVFTREGFLAKMTRTNPLRIYGLRTLLYGTLLPAPLTGLAHRAPLRRLEREGHEVGLHAWDHVRWHDELAGWSEEEVAAELELGLEAFAEVMGRAPWALAAPGWQATPASLAVQDRLGLAYASDTRGREPFRPVMGGRRFGTLQIPATLPTVDELVGRDGLTPEGAVDFLERALDPQRLNVYTGHAEIEGGYLADAFARLLQRLVQRGARFVTLKDVAFEYASRRAPLCHVDPGLIEGRAGTVALQRDEIADEVAAAA